MSNKTQPKKKTRKRKSVAKATEVVLTNHIAIVLDRSWSMNQIGVSKVIEAVNSQIQANKAAAAQTGQKTTFSFYTFGDLVSKIMRNRPIDRVRKITSRDYQASGMTALEDGVGVAINDLRSLPDANNKDTSFVVICITDGEENNSRLYKGRLGSLIKEVQKTGRWSIAFTGPARMKAYLTGLGVPAGNIEAWQEGDVASFKQMSDKIRMSTARYFDGRTKGIRGSTAFFVDAVDVSSRDLSQMHNVSEEFATFAVTGRNVNEKGWVEIRDFINAKLRSATIRRRVGSSQYETGNAFYQLTKAETLQPGKEIVIRHNISGKMYSGTNARSILNLPVGGSNIRIRPGDFGDYTIFIESTSVNRHLFPGTEVLYVKS
jgi:uncharacterized protein YegL